MSRPGAGTRAAELRKQLLRLARERREDFQVVLSRYGVERLLYRLSRTPHGEAFILKGAMLVGTWAEVPHRTTRDVDFLGLGEPSPSQLSNIFREVAIVEGGDDAIVFDPKTVRVDDIREEDRYGGLRVRMTADFGGAVVHVQMDVGFGDAVVPAAEWIDYPTLLGLPAPRVRAYTRYTVISEKLEAIVSLGLVNSRMKDFYDLWVLSMEFEFDGELLGRAIRATFERRGTEIPAEVPPALGDEFAGDTEKQQQWRAFVTRSQLRHSEAKFGQVIRDVRDFVTPVLTALAAGDTSPRRWAPKGPWR
ncbi:MAG: nucleotidyl transferase AbiEii/AbiGii toxin family protein [Candidatus Eisenbacteria bacterium]